MRTLRRCLRRARLLACLRVVAALLALVAAGAPDVASVTEGILAAGAGRGPAVTHVEDRRHADCPFVHAADCALCACMAHLAMPAAPQRLATVRPEAGPTPAARQEFWRATAVAAAPARAPPAG